MREAGGLTQQQVADRMSVTKDQVSQIEQGKVSGQDVVARFAAPLGGRLCGAGLRPPPRPATRIPNRSGPHEPGRDAALWVMSRPGPIRMVYATVHAVPLTVKVDGRWLLPL